MIHVQWKAGRRRCEKFKDKDEAAALDFARKLLNEGAISSFDDEDFEIFHVHRGMGIVGMHYFSKQDQQFKYHEFG